MIAGKVALVLQARMGSTRLPGKALEVIGGHTVLGHCIERLKTCGAGPIIVATTRQADDDAIEEEARQYRVSVYRGETEDVLGRFVGAAARVQAEFVVRATADNPAVDMRSADRLLETLRRTWADHAVESDMPVGTTVEVVRTAALWDADRRATTATDREHVTTFIRRKDSGFRCAVLPALPPLRRPDLRFTIDVAADLEYMRDLIQRAEAVATAPAELTELIQAADISVRHEGVA